MGEPQHSRHRSAPASSNDGSGEDRISGLPDELLHDILHLVSVDAAARTSVLSRRWRHVWAHLPQLRFVAPPDAAGAASFMDSVDAALGGYLAPTIEHLCISISTNQLGSDLHVLCGRIASLLHFAAEHVVSELYLSLFMPRTLRLGVLAGEVVFTALRHLEIGGNVCMQGNDITALVNTQCPCLRELSLHIRLIVIFDVFIHSNSLRTLVLGVLETRLLEILAPRLEELTIVIKPMEAHISAPKLSKVAWHDAYDPHLHQFVEVGRTLQLLKTFYPASSLTKRFDEVDELYMNMDIHFPDVPTYARLLSETNKLPKCKSFIVSLSWEYHALVPVILQLLRSCNGTKKFRVELFGGWSPVMHRCLLSCPCHLEKSRKFDGIDLSSLEVVEIRYFCGSHEQMQLLEFISNNTRALKRLLIINDEYCHRPKEVPEKVRSMFHPNVKVELSVFREGRQVFID